MENKKVIITSGDRYLDIDAYAGMIAYKALLQSLGKNAYAYSSASTNQSVSNKILELPLCLDKVEVKDTDNFIVLDVSHPDSLDAKCNVDNIIEIIDHHTGYEEFWKNKLGKNSQIEFIGSVCTIIYEKFKQNNKLELLTKEHCKLLIAGILDNTLNLKARITNKRDVIAYQDLLRLGNLDENWGMEYFKSCYETLENELEFALKNDIKSEEVSTLLPVNFGQLIVLDVNTINKNMQIVENVFSEFNDFILNVICLKDGKSYIYFNGKGVKEKLEFLFNEKANNNLIVLNQCMLRKEIIKLAREKQ